MAGKTAAALDGLSSRKRFKAFGVALLKVLKEGSLLWQAEPPLPLTGFHPESPFKSFAVTNYKKG